MPVSEKAKYLYYIEFSISTFLFFSLYSKQKDTSGIIEGGRGRMDGGPLRGGPGDHRGGAPERGRGRGVGRGGGINVGGTLLNVKWRTKGEVIKDLTNRNKLNNCK